METNTTIIDAMNAHFDAKSGDQPNKKRSKNKELVLLENKRILIREKAALQLVLLDIKSELKLLRNPDDGFNEVRVKNMILKIERAF